MAVFSTNQNRQLYVVNAYNATVDDTTVVGSVKEGIIGDVKVVDGALHIKYKGADNTLKSDYIQLKNLDYAKAIAAADMITPLKKIKVTLDANVNGGLPIIGQDYVLRINFFHWIGMSELDQYFKDAAVHATAAMAADVKEFYKAMVNALNISFSRELGASKTSNPYLNFSAGTAGSEDGIYITEKEQEWQLGTESQERVLFDVVPTTVYLAGTGDVEWAAYDATTNKPYQDLTPAKSAAVAGSTGIGNGKAIADLEYFCMGERGDQYRNVGWPNVINTKYLVDASKEYNALEIHHAFTDTGVNSYRSEKDITIVAEDVAELNKLINAINSAAGTSIAPL